eukprot:1157558-Pelagomonas_calceolata.AAC.1
MSKIYDWFEERLEIQAIADDITIQVATGFAMTFYYRPTVAEAFASVQYLMTDVNFGWLIRSIHRWSASGFKRPRELTWLSGVIMAVCTVSFGVTGVPEAIPVIGGPLVELLRGGVGVGQSTLTRPL